MALNKMQTKSIQLPSEVWNHLEQKAEMKKLSVTALIRETIIHTIENTSLEGDAKDDELLKLQLENENLKKIISIHETNTINLQEITKGFSSILDKTMPILTAVQTFKNTDSILHQEKQEANTGAITT